MFQTAQWGKREEFLVWSVVMTQVMPTDEGRPSGHLPIGQDSTTNEDQLHLLFAGWIHMTAQERQEKVRAACNMLTGWAYTQKINDRPIPQDLVREAEIDLAFRLGSVKSTRWCLKRYNQALTSLQNTAQKALKEREEAISVIQHH